MNSSAESNEHIFSINNKEGGVATVMRLLPYQP